MSKSQPGTRKEEEWGARGGAFAGTFQAGGSRAICGTEGMSGCPFFWWWWGVDARLRIDIFGAA